STSSQPLVVQRDASNSTDLPIVSRTNGDLYLGSSSENNHYRALGQVLFELFEAGVGWAFSTAQSGLAYAIRSDSNHTVVQGAADEGKDGVIRAHYPFDSAATGPVTIAEIAIPDNAVT